MIKKLTTFIKSENFIVKGFIIGLLMLLVSTPAVAHFLRQTGDAGWGYGYGYGYGYGFGWDGGTEAGYKTDFSTSAANVYGYGFGYGNLLGSYDPATGITLTSTADLATLHTTGLISIVGTDPTATSSVTFEDKLTLNLSASKGTITVTIPSGATFTPTAGGNFDFTALTSSDVTNASGISGQDIASALQFGISGVGITSDTAVTISIPTYYPDGQTVNVYKSDSGATSGWSLLTTCTISGGACSFTTTSFSHFAATQSSSTSATGGGGGGVSPVAQEEEPVTPAEPATIEVSEILVTDPSDVNSVLTTLGVTRDLTKEAKYAPLINEDLSEFDVTAIQTQKNAMVNFVTYGISTATQKFGSGERRAILRDYLETVGRTDVVWSDIELIATGQKPIQRNLTKEQGQLGQVLVRFEKLFGHRPNFEDANEDLAWNTMMYRIRFTRDLEKEKAGIGQFRTKMGRIPTSPLDWSAVRALGYIF